MVMFSVFRIYIYLKYILDSGPGLWHRVQKNDNILGKYTIFNEHSVLLLGPLLQSPRGFSNDIPLWCFLGGLLSWFSTFPPTAVPV